MGNEEKNWSEIRLKGKGIKQRKAFLPFLINYQFTKINNFSKFLISKAG